MGWWKRWEWCGEVGCSGGWIFAKSLAYLAERIGTILSCTHHPATLTAWYERRNVPDQRLCEPEVV